MLVVKNNTESFYFNKSMIVQPLDISTEVVIAIDPSKTNMAILIGSPFEEIYDILEFSGNNRKRGPAMDTTLYCEEVRSFLSQYLSKVDIYMVGVEAAITKRGMNHHHSNMVLTEIRANILNFFLERFYIKVEEINNWSWKYAVLPQGYRSQSEKGSKRYMRDYFPTSSLNDYFEADVTDVYCIYKYMCTKLCKGYNFVCNRHEEPNDNTRNFYIYPPTLTSFPGARVVKLNDHFSVTENITYICNRTNYACYTVIPDISVLSLDEMYGHCKCFAEIPEEGPVVLIIPEATR